MRRRSYVIIGIIAFVAALSWIAVYLSTPGAPANTSFIVSPGDGVEKIIDGLMVQGFVRNRLLFKIDLKSSGLATHLQPGSYDLTGATSYENIIARLSSGGVAASEFTLTIIEGWDLRDIKRALDAAHYAQADRLYGVTGSPAGPTNPTDFSSTYAFLKEKPPHLSLEGYLFPDTYRIFKDATAEELTKILLANFARKLSPDLQQKIVASGHTTYQVITMASIIEKEVRGEVDKRKVSDIFWRRLKKGMALQADSTVNYVTEKDHAAVSYDDTRNASRYNTYKYPGLPLGPIDNPGLESIRAALDPDPNPYWYFLTDTSGAVHYATTFEEHNRNKRRFLR